MAGVTADAADQDLVATGCLNRHRVTSRGGLIDDEDTRQPRSSSSRHALGGELLGRLHVQRLRVAGEDRHPGAGGGDPNLLVESDEDLAGLGHHLALLGGVVITVAEDLDLGQAR